MAPTASKQAAKRLAKEYAAIQKEPPPFVFARPNEANILEWHFILRGPPDSPYAGGEYYGLVTFPADYPFAPPGIKVNTPSGRFTPGAAICTSMSNFHPGSWNPAWSVQTILTGLLSFMLSDEITTGSMKAPNSERVALASTSHAWNIANAKFRSIFPEYSHPTMTDLPDMGAGPRASTSSDAPTTSASTTPAVANANTVPPPLPSPIADLLKSITEGVTPPPSSTANGIGIGTAEELINAKEKEKDAGRVKVGWMKRWRRELIVAFVVLLLSWVVVRVGGGVGL